MALITGTEGFDTLTGTAGADTINGLGGNDTIEGGVGDDVINGGDGDDRISDEGGSDVLSGGDGDDYFFISRGNRGAAAENVRIEGGTGQDRVVYQNYRAGNLIADLGEGDDTISLLTIQNGGTRLTLGTGSDTVIVESSVAFEMTGQLTITDFTAGSAGDVLDWSRYLSNVLTGWDTSTNPFGSSGYARLAQSGTDTLVQIDLDGAANGASFFTLATFQNVTASQLNSYNFGGFHPDGSPPPGLAITGTEGSDTLTGTAGADTINGLGGNDTIEGGVGDDVTNGGDGDDRISDEGGSDVLSGGAGDDYFFISRGNRGAAAENVRIEGGTGQDRIVYQNYRAGNLIADLGEDDDTISLLTIQNGGTRLTLGTGSDTVIVESSVAFEMTGQLTITDFTAGSAGDVLDWSRYLSNVLTGWDSGTNPFGSTSYARLVQSGADTLVQIDRDGAVNGAGFSTFATFQNVTASQLTSYNFGGFNPDGSPPPGMTITGNEGSDTLTGTAGADTINGLGGNDTIDGGIGDDLIDGGDGDDRISDEGGSDVLSGGAGDDYFFISRGNRGAAAENVRIEGGTGQDRVVYQNYRAGNLIADLGDGDDTISLLTIQNGGTRLTLGTGSDTVIVESSVAFEMTGQLTITDFTAGSAGDVLDWSRYLSNVLTGWDTSTNPFGSSGYARLAQSGTDTLVQIDLDGAANGASFFTLATFQNVTASQLTSANFVGLAPQGITFFGTSSPDQIVGTDRNDVLIGFASDDTLNGGVGADTLIGGTGNDTYFVDNAADVIVEMQGDGNDTVAASSSYVLATGASVELLTTGWIGGTTAINLAGNELSNEIWGNDGVNVLNGGDGNDALIGFDGDDTLIGGRGANALLGGMGNDTYYVENASDVVVEAQGEGNDTVAASLSYALNAGASIELLTTGWIGGTASINLTGNELNNEIWGNAAVNVLNGGDGNDALVGFGGDDTLIGGRGADALIGGIGNDTYYVDNTDDVVAEALGEGLDTVAASISYALSAGTSIELLTTGWIGGAAVINLTGNEQNNEIWGNAAVNVLSGGDGNDALVGFDGDDTLIGGLGADALIGGAGNDTYYVDDATDLIVEASGEGNDTVAASTSYALAAAASIELLTTGWIDGNAAINLTGNELKNEIWGNAAANVLNGGDGDDTLVGFAGDDTLVGGGGADGLIGGDGRDTFAFITELSPASIDRVADFTVGSDRIMLASSVFTGLSQGILADGTFVSGTAALDANDRIIYDALSGDLFFDADGNGSAAAVQFAILGSNLNLSATDFVIG